MRVTVEFIDNKGFWHQKIAKSKKLLMEWLNLIRDFHSAALNFPDTAENYRITV